MPDTKMPSNNMPNKNISAAALAPYRVSAYNTAHDSENKIHDDATARRFGFGGGLVPGVDVYGYITHMPVAQRSPRDSTMISSPAASSPAVTVAVSPS